MRLIGTAPLDEIIETMIWTSRVEKALPISALMVAGSGTGKSKTLLQYQGKTLHRCDDITSAGLHDLLSQDRENKIGHIVIPDFNLPLSHKGSVSNLTVASMLTLMSDGTMEIRDARRNVELNHRPVGFLTAVTYSMFLGEQKHWSKLGLLRRFFPLFFSYTTKTTREAQRAISKDRVNLQQTDRIQIVLPDKISYVRISSKDSEDIETLAVDIGKNLGLRKHIQGGKTVWVHHEHEEIAPMSPQLTLQALVRAHAIRAKRTTVGPADMDFLRNTILFTNPSSPVKL